MNKKIKAAWLKELRHPDTKQIQCKLTDGVGFCCLGVLCNMGADRAKRWKQNKSGVLEYGGNSIYPPNFVLRKAGLSSDLARALAIKNDHGRTFAQIADWIEANL